MQLFQRGWLVHDFGLEICSASEKPSGVAGRGGIGAEENPHLRDELELKIDKIDEGQQVTLPCQRICQSKFFFPRISNVF